jgi:hypothetical protein
MKIEEGRMMKRGQSVGQGSANHVVAADVSRRILLRFSGRGVGESMRRLMSAATAAAALHPLLGGEGRGEGGRRQTKFFEDRMMKRGQSAGQSRARHSVRAAGLSADKRRRTQIKNRLQNLCVNLRASADKKSGGGAHGVTRPTIVSLFGEPVIY